MRSLCAVARYFLAAASFACASTLVRASSLAAMRFRASAVCLIFAVSGLAKTFSAAIIPSSVNAFRTVRLRAFTWPRRTPRSISKRSRSLHVFDLGLIRDIRFLTTFVSPEDEPVVQQNDNLLVPAEV